MTLREFGYSLERWGVSLLEWFTEYLRVFFWQTSWLDASLFMLFWVIIGYFIVINLLATKLSRWLKDHLEHRKKYKEDSEYRQEYDAEQKKQKQEQDRNSAIMGFLVLAVFTYFVLVND
ncbi:MAG: hypothetical protein CML80_05550 [Rhodobiaceae bacterium]|nr:hypothetical protein [Rhodobiaceae bacterium]OUT91125.1 MAG: hypothetical protein CBB89_06400 [Rhizobiales bacterium TMED29]|tara:strand:- start:1271 stop:1627 length:357 start_codon:yes stop_codon:yes gene_type:complete